MLRTPSPANRGTLVALALALLGASGRARAQDAGLADAAPAAGQIALAREEFRRGTVAAHADHWPEALEHFTRADELLDHSRPEVLLDLAGAQVQTGHLVAGVESYRRFLRDVTDGPLAVHRASAQQTLDQVQARTPHVQIAAPGLLPDDELAVDGVLVAHAVLGAAFPVDPGDHTVVVTRAGVEIGRDAFRVAEAQARVVDFELPAPPPAALDAGTDAAPPVDAAAPGDGRDTARRIFHIPVHHPPTTVFASPWFWVATGGVLVLLGAGAGAGAYVATTPQPFESSQPLVRVRP